MRPLHSKRMLVVMGHYATLAMTMIEVFATARLAWFYQRLNLLSSKSSNAYGSTLFMIPPLHLGLAAIRLVQLLEQVRHP